MNAELLARLNKIEDGIWELPRSFRKKMNVPVRIFATEKLLNAMDEEAVEQAVNVAALPGITEASFMMPDAHWGYGFPVGGVAAFDMQSGIISPGGIGFDINCGMRLITTTLTENEVRPKIENLINRLFDEVPAGVASSGKIRLSERELKEVAVNGAKWAIDKGWGEVGDLECIEEKGKISGVNPEDISDRAYKRGRDQLGTLGSGNHYLEVQSVETIFDPKKALQWGILDIGQVCVMIHSGSRGFGHQIASDYLNIHERSLVKYKIQVEDRQLACAPFTSNEGQRYFSAMGGAANFAFCNRQVITHHMREVFEEIFAKPVGELGMKLVYDVAHNIAKIERFEIMGKQKELLVHRKGATRAYPGQPVIIGGSMETGSYLLVGTEGALRKAFASTAHGSGRTMSRTQAKKEVSGLELSNKMKEKGIYVRSASYSDLAEEAGLAYKDISEVVKAVSISDISQPVASFKPIGNIKG